jgi:hypothetical protein
MVCKMLYNYTRKIITNWSMDQLTLSPQVHKDETNGLIHAKEPHDHFHHIIHKLTTFLSLRDFYH